MRYLKKFNELFENRQIYNKKTVIDFILSDMKLEDDDLEGFRKELEQTPDDEFDDMAKQSGLTKIGRGFWTYE